MALIETDKDARRLARAIASDLSLYNEEKIINGIENDDKRENILWGMSAGYSFAPWLGVSFKYIRSDSQREIGTSSDRYILSLSTVW